MRSRPPTVTTCGPCWSSGGASPGRQHPTSTARRRADPYVCLLPGSSASAERDPSETFDRGRPDRVGLVGLDRGSVSGYSDSHPATWPGGGSRTAPERASPSFRWATLRRGQAHDPRVRRSDRRRERPAALFPRVLGQTGCDAGGRLRPCGRSACSLSISARLILIDPSPRLAISAGAKERHGHSFGGTCE